MRHRLVRASLIALAVSATCLAPVAADDTGAPVDEGLLGNLDLGTCEGLGWADGDSKAIIRSSSEPRFANGSVLRLSVISIMQAPNARLEISIVDDEIALPDDWRELPASGDQVSSFPDGWRYDYVVTGLAEGQGSGSVTWGVSVDGGPASPYPSRLTVSVSPPCPEDYPSDDPSPPASDTDAATRWTAGPPAFDLRLLLILGAAVAIFAERRFAREDDRRERRRPRTVR